MYYLSKRFHDYETTYTPYKTRYTPIEKSCFALVWAIQKLRHIILPFHVWVIAQMDPLKYLFEKPALSGKLSRWLILLAKFNLKYVVRKTIKGSVVSGFCAENPIEKKDGKEDFPDEDILDIELGAWKMYFNGAVNQYGNGIGVLLISPDGSHMPLAVKLNFEATKHGKIWSSYHWNESSLRVKGKRGRDIWRFNLGYSSSLEVMEAKGRTCEA